MKNSYLIFLFLFVLSIPVLQSCEPKTNEIDPNGSGEFPTAADIERFIKAGVVSYGDFGAKGDGATDDMETIVATHAFANKHNLKVKADNGATYYISGKDRTAVIRTDTDFGSAKFIIDDSNVENRVSYVFSVASIQEPFTLGEYAVTSLKRDQKNIGIKLPGTCIVSVTNSLVKHYIRQGVNQTNGSSQTDIFLVDKDGNVDERTPIIWDFDNITSMNYTLIDETELKITGGEFTTIAHTKSTSYTNRGLSIARSNVTVDGLKHYVTGESSSGAPYNGFLFISRCTDVTVKNSTFTGRRDVKTAGSYDISIGRALNVTFENCDQTNNINDPTYWGVMGSNYCKNMVFDNCDFSRFDAHQGVNDVTIRNSSLGWQGVSIIGSGKLIVENSTINGSSMINLRSDYGSTWEGEILIKDCVFVPRQPSYANIIGGSNRGQHFFGYVCYMPERITIENLHIDDSKSSSNYKGPALFADFNTDMVDDSYVEKYPYVLTKEVTITNLTTESGKPFRVSDNMYMFKDVVVK